MVQQTIIIQYVSSKTSRKDDQTVDVSGNSMKSLNSNSKRFDAKSTTWMDSETFTILGPYDTRHFCTQYCNKKIILSNKLLLAKISF